MSSTAALLVFRFFLSSNVRIVRKVYLILGAVGVLADVQAVFGFGPFGVIGGRRRRLFFLVAAVSQLVVSISIISTDRGMGPIGLVRTRLFLGLFGLAVVRLGASGLSRLLLLFLLLLVGNVVGLGVSVRVAELKGRNVPVSDGMSVSDRGR